MKEKQKNKYSKSMIIPIVLGLLLLILFKNAESRLEQLMIGLIFIINLIPFTLHLISMLFLSSISAPKEKLVAENIIQQMPKSRSKIESQGIKQDYKAKTNNNVIYLDVRSRLIEAIKNGHLDRNSVLKFKLEIDNRLGMNRYAYKDFEYENDLHEIYIKLKSSKLTDDDYTYLKSLIEDLVGWFFMCSVMC